MLKCKGIVVTKKANGELDKMAEYDRWYYAFGPNDEVETGKKMVGGKEIGEVTFPKNEKSVHSEQELMKSALDYLQALRPAIDPKTGKLVQTPVQTLLEFADYGGDLKAQAPIRQNLSKEPMGEDVAIEKMAKILVSMGAQPNLEAAIAYARQHVLKQVAA